MRSVDFRLTEWVRYTEKEMQENHAKMQGYLKTYTYEEAWVMWWNKLSKEAKKTIQEIPNFNTEIFKEITGIALDVNMMSNVEITKGKTATLTDIIKFAKGHRVYPYSKTIS